jgi:hypothetical protein
VNLGFFKMWSPSEQREFILTSCIALFTVLNGVATTIYVCEFTKSATDASRQTDKLIDAADTQARAASRNARSARKMALSADRQASYAQQIAGQTLEQAQATNRLAERAARSAYAAEVSNKNSLNADRPWLGASLVVDQEMNVGNSPTASIFFVNSGKRPAIVTSLAARSHLFDVFPEDPPYEPVQTSTSFLVPGATLTIKIKLSTDKLNEADIAELNGSQSFYIFARVMYTDTESNISHYTHACWKYFTKSTSGPSPSGFYNCNIEEGYNDAK